MILGTSLVYGAPGSIWCGRTPRITVLCQSALIEGKRASLLPSLFNKIKRYLYLYIYTFTSISSRKEEEEKKKRRKIFDKYKRHHPRGGMKMGNVTTNHVTDGINCFASKALPPFFVVRHKSVARVRLDAAGVTETLSP